MADDAKHLVTQILNAATADPTAAQRLLPIVYDELRGIARARLREEKPGHTLQATALVHEAYLKLVGSAAMGFSSRGHFFGACANAMRQILVDHARRRGARKRGGDRRREEADAAEVAGTSDLGLVLDVDACMERLRGEDERAARVVELRFFGGLEMEEVAEAMGISLRTANREWAFARARLQQLMGEPDAKEAGDV